jgi:hypothetical protein
LGRESRRTYHIGLRRWADEAEVRQVGLASRLPLESPGVPEANMRSALELHVHGMAEDGLEIRSDDVVVRQITLATQ